MTHTAYINQSLLPSLLGPVTQEPPTLLPHISQARGHHLMEACLSVLQYDTLHLMVSLQCVYGTQCVAGERRHIIASKTMLDVFICGLM